MAKTAPAPLKDVAEVTRELLIALSCCLPDKILSSKDSLDNSSTENPADGIDSDATEKYRAELILLSYLQSPEINNLPVAELKA